MLVTVVDLQLVHVCIILQSGTLITIIPED